MSHHTCPRCGETFEDLAAYRDHLKEEIEVKRLKAELKGPSFFKKVLGR